MEQNKPPPNKKAINVKIKKKELLIIQMNK